MRLGFQVSSLPRAHGHDHIFDWINIPESRALPQRNSGRIVVLQTAVLKDTGRPEIRRLEESERSNQFWFSIGRELSLHRCGRGGPCTKSGQQLTLKVSGVEYSRFPGRQLIDSIVGPEMLIT